MESYYKFIETTENVLMPLGLMEGDAAVPKRMLVGAVLGSMLILLIKPSSMFENGVARPWTFLSGSEPTQGPRPTSTPWFIVPGMTAIFLGMFV